MPLNSRYVGRMSQRLLDRICQQPVKNENNQNAKVNQLILYRIVTQRLKIICYTTKNVHLSTTRTINFLFFLKRDPISIYQS